MAVNTLGMVMQQVMSPDVLRAIGADPAAWRKFGRAQELSDLPTARIAADWLEESGVNDDFLRQLRWQMQRGESWVDQVPYGFEPLGLLDESAAGYPMEVISAATFPDTAAPAGYGWGLDSSGGLSHGLIGLSNHWASPIQLPGPGGPSGMVVNIPTSYRRPYLD